MKNESLRPRPGFLAQITSKWPPKPRDSKPASQSSDKGMQAASQVDTQVSGRRPLAQQVKEGWSTPQASHTSGLNLPGAALGDRPDPVAQLSSNQAALEGSQGVTVGLEIRIAEALTTNTSDLDVRARVAQLETVMQGGGASHLRALRAIIVKECQSGSAQIATCISFKWMQKHLAQFLEITPNAERQGLSETINEAYSDYICLADAESDDVRPAIVAGSGAVELKILNYALNVLANPQVGVNFFSRYDLELECKRLARRIYVRTVVDGVHTNASSSYPGIKHTDRALLIVGHDFYVDDSVRPKLETVWRDADIVCRLLGSPHDSPHDAQYNKDDSDKTQWHNLASIFHDACKHLLSVPDIVSRAGGTGILEKVTGYAVGASLSFPYLKYAVMCYNCGLPFPLANFKPPLSLWLACQDGSDPDNQQNCSRVLEEVFKQAANAELGRY